MAFCRLLLTVTVGSWCGTGNHSFQTRLAVNHYRSNYPIGDSSALYRLWHSVSQSRPQGDPAAVAREIPDAKKEEDRGV